MGKKYSLELQSTQTQSMKQMQRLMMSPQMQQALHLLQLPIMELSAALSIELESNPVLEFSQDPSPSEEEEELAPEVLEKELVFDERDFEVLKQLDEDFQGLYEESSSFTKRTSEDDKYQSYLENQISAEESLFEHLMKQARDFFQTPEELAMAEAIIGNFDENGYLNTPLVEIAALNTMDKKKLHEVLEGIQTFEPFGVGAQNMKEAMLIQMRCMGKRDTLAYRIVEEDYDNLLHNRIPQIQRHQRCSLEEIAEVIDKHISKLDLHPGAWYSKAPVQTIVPDLSIIEEDGKLSVRIQDDSLPSIKLNSRYLRMLNDPDLNEETREFIKHKISSAKWLIKNVLQRNSTLERIGNAIIDHQKDFLLNPKGDLHPLTMKTLAEELDVHESTVARAVNNKYIETPRGVMPFRSFFTSALEQKTGDDVSSSSARDIIAQLIRDEDKQAPLSDEVLAQLLQAKGIQCARRTVAKYRGMLKLGSARQRRKFSS